MNNNQKKEEEEVVCEEIEVEDENYSPLGKYE